MGDHRATIKIQIEFHEVKKSIEMSINWIEPTMDVIDEFFEEVHGLGMKAYNKKREKYWEEQEEKEERKMYQSLKKKYKHL